MRVLFVDQGRPRPEATFGTIRVQHAVQAGLPAVDGRVDAVYDAIPPFTRGERRFMRPVQRWDRLNLGSVRWHLARGWGARRLVRRHLATAAPPDVAHLTAGRIGFLLEDVQRTLPCVLSLDTLAIDWARAKRAVPLDAATPSYLRALEPLERRALRRAPLNIAWTETVARRVREFAPGATVTALHPGLDLEAFRPARSPTRGGRLRVLFVGGRWEEKGGPDLLAALAPRLGRDVELDVVTREAFDAPDGVHVHRAAPGTSLVPELFARADVFCLPSHVDAVPFVVLEAMASGVPVVSTRIFSIPELVGDGGIVCEPGDVAGLAAALGELLEDPERRRAAGEAGRARAERHYDARKTTPRLIELLREVVDRHRRRA